MIGFPDHRTNAGKDGILHAYSTCRTARGVNIIRLKECGTLAAIARLTVLDQTRVWVTDQKADTSAE